MKFEMTEHVPGLTEADVARLVGEAEAGYDISEARLEHNPHARGGYAVPEDLTGAIEERARRDGHSPETVVRAAIRRYLDSA